jgi:hypothetical protein
MVGARSVDGRCEGGVRRIGFRLHGSLCEFRRSGPAIRLFEFGGAGSAQARVVERVTLVQRGRLVADEAYQTLRFRHLTPGNPLIFGKLWEHCDFYGLS